MVDSADHEPKLEIPAGGEVTFVRRSEVAPAGGLEAAARRKLRVQP